MKVMVFDPGRNLSMTAKGLLCTLHLFPMVTFSQKMAIQRMRQAVRKRESGNEYLINLLTHFTLQLLFHGCKLTSNFFDFVIKCS